jgi:hypothetical protein
MRETNLASIPYSGSTTCSALLKTSSAGQHVAISAAALNEFLSVYQRLVRAKKEALFSENYDALKELAKGREEKTKELEAGNLVSPRCDPSANSG